MCYFLFQLRLSGEGLALQPLGPLVPGVAIWQPRPLVLLSVPWCNPQIQLRPFQRLHAQASRGFTAVAGVCRSTRDSRPGTVVSASVLPERETRQL